MTGKITSLFAITLFMSFCSGLVMAAETPPVLTAYSCQYNAGQGAKDLNGAVEFWQAQMKKLGNPETDSHFAAVVTPFLATTQADFYWFGVDPNLNAMARGGAAYAGSKEGQAADARFAKVATCTANTFFLENIYQGMAPEEGDTDTVIEMFGCTLKEGKSMVNVNAVEAFWKARTTEAGASVNVYRWTPFYANTPFDLVYLGVHDDLVSFGATTTASVTSADAPSINMAWDSVMDCESGLFTGHMVHMPKPQQ